MSKRGSHIPRKLTIDAIVEAVFEVRFRTSTSPEFLLVRLADFEPWASFSQGRLPAHSIPDNVREMDPNLKFQPTFELADPQRHISLRVGPYSFSYHMRSPYEGWPNFNEQLRLAVKRLFAKTEDLKATRLGLRYVNLLDHKHRVRSISDLDLSLLIAGEKITSRVNITYVHEVSSDMAVTVRMTASELLINPESGVLVDVDVYTKDSFETNMEETVVDWLKRAHDAEKEEFFSLLHDASISALEDKQ